MPKKKGYSLPKNVPQLIAEGVLLYQAETTLFKMAERSLLGFGMSAAQVMLLGVLYWDGRPLVPTRICNTLVVERQALTGTIDALENKGLAKRLSHPTDRRKIRVQITPEGRKKYEEASGRTDQALETYFQALTPGERQQLRATLTKLRGNGYPFLGLSHDLAYPAST